MEDESRDSPVRVLLIVVCAIAAVLATLLAIGLTAHLSNVKDSVDLEQAVLMRRIAIVVAVVGWFLTAFLKRSKTWR